jgi:glycosyltransferase involved in cell wall biosynthesis
MTLLDIVPGSQDVDEFPPVARGDELELSIVMPCLNERETLGICIRKAQQSLAEHCVVGEVVIADNGSTDGSQEIARKLGARVIAVAEKGYGSALRSGIAAARGRYVIMGDSDESYDFSSLYPFVERLREGYELVMGNRFRGGIMPGAMPWKHRWIGNPVLSWIGRLFFKCPVRDFHCGLRGFAKDAYQRMQLQTTGMEFASEMVIKSTLQLLRITEVPTVLHKDGRSRPPHLRSWRDGWRHLRFMCLFSPRWLFLIPGLMMLLLGSIALIWLGAGQRRVGPVSLDIHTLLVAAFVVLLGYQLIIFGLFTKIFAITEGLHPGRSHLNKVPSEVNLEVGVLLGLITSVAGAVVLGLAVWGWRRTGFGALDPRVTMRQLIPAVLLMIVGIQTIFASFFLSVLTLRRKK